MTPCADCSAGWVVVAGDDGWEPARCPTCRGDGVDRGGLVPAHDGRFESERLLALGRDLLWAIMAADHRHTSRDGRGRWGRVVA